MKDESAVSKAVVSKLEYDAVTHSIPFSLDCQGCTVGKHSLVYSELCSASYPPQCGAVVTQSAEYDASCDTAQHEDLEFALSDEQNGMVLILEKATKRIRA